MNFQTLIHLARACTSSPSPLSGLAIHCHSLKLALLTHKTTTTTFLSNSLVHMYGTTHQLELARQLFDEMPQRDQASFTIILSSYSACNEPHRALSLLSLMHKVGAEVREWEMPFWACMESVGALRKQGEFSMRCLRGVW
ncbi:hypothetical protein AMTR_s00012p00130130 [Amborella trichopoda]|uniref:Pentacotripeptide-repeat region of PRORP domain-containing protein n=1 Tax=Amborella trichopoda TaxID=13333 RepID=W1PJ68_AMBTC|nr:hypothetical protein AMTR_s00012p00130130 [Amborella trichopoda]